MRPPLTKLTSLWMLFFSSFLLSTFQLLCLLFFRTVLCSEAEERLVRDLFRDYNKLIRPVELINRTVEVRFVMYLIQLINVNEKNQVMTTNVWLELRWNDYQFKWDPADYGGVKTLRVPADKVWKPDLVLFNNADGNYEVRFKSNVLISSNSEVQWVPPAIYQSSCRIDVTYFPFDQQKCEMKFSSWTFNGDQVSLSFSADPWVDLSDYSKSGTWDIVEVPGFLNVYNNSKFGKPTETDITFHITIRRKTLFYTVNLILPTLLISFLCILVFYLPAEAGEKVTLGISILLSLVVFLLLVSKILPPTSLVLPLIAKYLLFTFIMNCISILVTVVIINWNFRGPRTHRMPNWVRVVFLKYLPMLLYMKRPKRTRLRWMMDMPSLGVHYHPSRSARPGSVPVPGSGDPVTSMNGTGLSSTIEVPSSSPGGRLSPSPSSLPAHHHHHHHRHHHPYHHQPVPSSPGGLGPDHPAISRKLGLDSLEMSDLGSTCLAEGGGSLDGGGPLSSTNPLHHSHHHHHPHLVGQSSSLSDDRNISQSSYDPFGNNSPSHTFTSNQYRPNYLCGPSERSLNGAQSPGHPLQQHAHHPTTADQQAPRSRVKGQLFDRDTSLDNRSIDMLCLSSAASKATEAIEFIAEHLRAEDEYIQIREDWKYVAMVIDRLQLYVFFLGTLSGTLAILLDAPHIFEYVDQDAVIANHTSKTLA